MCAINVVESACWCFVVVVVLSSVVVVVLVADLGCFVSVVFLFFSSLFFSFYYVLYY